MNLWEGLPLVPYLIYYVQKGSEVWALGHVSKHLVLAHELVDLLDTFDLKDLVNEEWITHLADVHEDAHGVVHQIDIIGADVSSFKHFQRWILLVIQFSVCNRDYLWAEKGKELLRIHLHCLESRVHQLVNGVIRIHDLRDANDLRLECTKDIHD